jgi:hypothetical protein
MRADLLILPVTIFLALCIPANAHHSFAAVFDVDSPIEQSGTVTKVEWMNPHAWVYLDVEKDGDDVENWAFELGSPNGLMRRGWTRKSLQVGDQIQITGYRARDGSNRGNVKSIVFPDGRELTGNSSRYK